MSELKNVLGQILAFREERDWEQFHTVKNLAAALSIEAAELQETILWKDAPEIAEYLKEGGREDMEEEVADVLIYALLLCHELDVDPIEAIEQKLEENDRKYPVDKAKGRADKYTELEDDG